MRVSGKTTDGISVVTGAYKFCGTIGLPLGVLTDELEKRGIAIDWVDFILDARKEGANYRTIRSKIFEAVSLPPMRKKVFMYRADEVLALIKKPEV